MKTLIYGYCPTWRTVWPLLAVVLVVSSCIRDDVDSIGPVKDNTTVTLSISIPGAGSATRAWTESDESRIEEIKILAFEDAAGTAGLLYGIYNAENITVDAENDSRRIFSVTLPKQPLRLEVLANSVNFISEASISSGMDPDYVTGRLSLTQTGKWDVTSATPVSLPFWGSASLVGQDDNYTVSPQPIDMIRDVARIDVTVADAARDEFKLRSVSVYNWQRRSRIIATETYVPDDKKVYDAIDTGSGFISDPNYVTYGASEMTTADVEIKEKIYVNETPNPGYDAFPEMPCLVLGAEVDGRIQYYRVDFCTTAADGTRTYFDLLRNHNYQVSVRGVLAGGAQTQDLAYNSTPAGIEVDIQQWNAGQTGNIIFQDGYFLRVEPGEFTVAKEEHTATLTRAPYETDDYFFEIESNTNWSIDQNSIEYLPASQTDWFSLNRWSGNADETTDMEILVKENTTGADRKATFTVAAGTIRYKAVVRQTEENLTWINVVGDFNYPPTASVKEHRLSINNADDYHYFEIDIEWYPADMDCNLEISSYSDGGGSYPMLDFADESEVKGNMTLTGGSRRLTVVCKPSGEVPLVAGQSQVWGRAAMFQFTVGDEPGAATKSFRLYTRPYINVNSNPTAYRMDITGQKFTVLSNAPLNVKDVKDEYSILTDATKTALRNLNSGQTSAGMLTPWTKSVELSFSTPDPKKDGKKAYVEFEYGTWMEGLEAPVWEIEAYYLLPNSYVVVPGQSVHIPVRKAFRAWANYPMYSELKLGNTMQVELLAESENGMITEVGFSPSSPLNSIDSEIVVRTTSGVEGNAMIALIVDDKIVWSWDLWVTTYDPENTSNQLRYTSAPFTTGDQTVYTTVFMTRNMGALSSTRNTNSEKFRAQGLLYQWGRKDPFAPARTITNSTRRIYNSSNCENYYYKNRGQFGTTPQAMQWATDLDAYIYSIQNPMTFITAAVEPYKWAVNEILSPWELKPYEDLYDMYKTEFDPCPDGWYVPQVNRPWGLINTFFNTGYVANNFGWRRSDGYYIPASGYIDPFGYLTEVGMYGANYTSMLSRPGSTSFPNVNYYRGYGAFVYWTSSSSSSFQWGFGSPTGEAAAFNVRCCRHIKQ